MWRMQRVFQDVWGSKSFECALCGQGKIKASAGSGKGGGQKNCDGQGHLRHAGIEKKQDGEPKTGGESWMLDMLKKKGEKREKLRSQRAGFYRGEVASIHFQPSKLISRGGRGGIYRAPTKECRGRGTKSIDHLKIKIG